MPTRAASHAGSWYSSNKTQLSKQLDDWLDAVPSSTKGIGAQSSQGAPLQIPCPRARAIIAPHAGYSYSGPPAAWAYKAIDWSNCRRVFLLGPSHHFYLTGCALSQCDQYATPLGNLKIDLEVVEELRGTGMFDDMELEDDEAEHSLEMHLPYIYKMFTRAFTSPANFPLLVPILVGSTKPATEQKVGELLASYLEDPTSIFILSSDFCHWGTRFRYTYYQPSSGPAVNLRSSDRPPTDPPIHQSIATVDQLCMDVVENGNHQHFLNVLEETGNTICGRHPIGVALAAIEALSKKASEAGRARFQFVRYERSSDCVNVRDSSVSYCSAFAVV